jgi:hypothetical protein
LLTISRLRRWSIKYYNETADAAKQAAMSRQAAGGGLGEYYSESDTRAPMWVVVGDAAAVGDVSGLDGAALDGGGSFVHYFRHQSRAISGGDQLRGLRGGPQLGGRVAADDRPRLCPQLPVGAQRLEHHPRQSAFEGAQRARAGVAFGESPLEIPTAGAVHADLHHGDAVNSGAELAVTPPGWLELHVDRS